MNKIAKITINKYYGYTNYETWEAFNLTSSNYAQYENVVDSAKSKDFLYFKAYINIVLDSHYNKCLIAKADRIDYSKINYRELFRRYAE